jgi:hypothetical protein
MKYILSIMVIMLLILFQSCNNDFNINAPYEDVYVLNCILRNDTKIQYAIISKNYFTDNGTVPSSDSINLNIRNSVIKIFYNDSVFVMRDTVISINGKSINCYYIKNMVISPGKDIRIEASVPNGKKLESRVRLPEISFSQFNANFPQSGSWGYLQKPNYSWNWIADNEDTKTVLGIPQLEIYYEKIEDGNIIEKKVTVPLASYFNVDEKGKLIPVDVKLAFNNFCVTTFENVNESMRNISGDDPYKKNYIINKVLFSVICLDSWLSKYYSAYNMYQENFTVKLRQTDVSNIEGGKGIFGAYYKYSKSLTVDSLYVNSFGYQFDPK